MITTYDIVADFSVRRYRSTKLARWYRRVAIAWLEVTYIIFPLQFTALLWNKTTKAVSSHVNTASPVKSKRLSRSRIQGEAGQGTCRKGWALSHALPHPAGHHCHSARQALASHYSTLDGRGGSVGATPDDCIKAVATGVGVPVHSSVGEVSTQLTRCSGDVCPLPHTLYCR